MQYTAASLHRSEERRCNDGGVTHNRRRLPLSPPPDVLPPLPTCDIHCSLGFPLPSNYTYPFPLSSAVMNCWPVLFSAPAYPYIGTSYVSPNYNSPPSCIVTEGESCALTFKYNSKTPVQWYLLRGDNRCSHSGGSIIPLLQLPQCTLQLTSAMPFNVL